MKETDKPFIDDEWVTTRQAAELCGQTYSAFKSAVWRSKLLRAARRDEPIPGKPAEWRRSIVIDWRDNHRQGSGNRTNHYTGPVSEWPRRDHRGT